PRQALAGARLYLVCDALADVRLEAALRGGVDIVQLRMKEAPDREIVAAGKRFRAACDAHGALLIVNDRPDLAVEIGADGVHVGQDDVAVREARRAIGGARLVGLSTHDPEQLDAACANPDVDYIGVGPVHATPTKPGRAAVGLELVRYAASAATVPFFAIGGIDAGNVAAVRAAGASRVAVVRALTQAADPEAAARGLSDALTSRREAGVGAA
ncbi:MAG: thiamine phosphate synthase, partial [Solirubrobacteraceae bacterium]